MDIEEKIDSSIVFARIHGTFEAVHQWSNAPEKQSYLRNIHRHLFVVTVEIEVTHDDREIEFYECKETLKGVLERMEKPLSFSCEQYAKQIYGMMAEIYGVRSMAINVLEDGLEGAVVIF